MREYGEVLHQLVAAVGGGMTPELQRRASRVHSRVMSALNQQEALLDRGGGIPLASEEAVLNSRAQETFIIGIERIRRRQQ